jgi:hypothetical protein
MAAAWSAPRITSGSASGTPRRSRSSRGGGDTIRGSPQALGAAHADLAFLAMTRRRLGRAQKAPEGLDRLRENLEDQASASRPAPGILARGPSGHCRLKPLAGEPCRRAISPQCCVPEFSPPWSAFALRVSIRRDRSRLNQVASVDETVDHTDARKPTVRRFGRIAPSNCVSIDLGVRGPSGVMD